MPNRYPHLPSLHALRFFETAARYGSITQAAREELAVTQGAVSRQIRLLEEELGTELFIKDGRGVRLTEHGRRLAGEVRTALDRLEEASRNLREESKGSQLAVTVLPSTAQQWLLPRLGEFHRQHADIDLRVVSANESLDLVRENIDAGIRYGGGPWEGLSQELLFHEELIVVCAPNYKKRYNQQRKLPRLQRPEDLHQHCLLYNTAREEDVWASYFKENARCATPTSKASKHSSASTGSSPPKGSSASTGSSLSKRNSASTGSMKGFRHYFLVIEAARQGLGVALVPSFLVDRELARGELVPALSVETEPRKTKFMQLGRLKRGSPWSYHLVFTPEAEKKRTFHAFRNFLLEETAYLRARSVPQL